MSRLTVKWPKVGDYVDNFVDDYIDDEPFKTYCNIGVLDKKLPITNCVISNEKSFDICVSESGLDNEKANPFNIRLSHTMTISPGSKQYIYLFDASDLPYKQIYDLIIDAFYKCKCEYCNKIRELINIPFIEIATAISVGASSLTYTQYE
jgi:hypothetical protein